MYDKQAISGSQSVRQCQTLHRSSRTNPCPICGRVKDSDCRWGDGWISCHSGAAAANLSPGQTVTIGGEAWYLSRTGGGHSGCSHIYRIDRPIPGRCRRQKRREDLSLAALVKRQATLLRPRVHAALRLRPWELCAPVELRLVHETLASAQELMHHLQRARRVDPTLNNLLPGLRHWIKALSHQRADLLRFERDMLGMQEGWR